MQIGFNLTFELNHKGKFKIVYLLFVRKCVVWIVVQYLIEIGN